MPRCKNCHKAMIADIENSKYICECGYEIIWVTQRREFEMQDFNY